MEQRLYSFFELSAKVFEEADDERDGPASGVKALDEFESLLRLGFFFAER